jgi:porphobilinogen synthase
MPRRRATTAPVAWPPSPRSVRPRRLRRTARLRAWVAETELSARQLVLPVFLRTGEGPPSPLKAMPGVCRWPVGALGKLARELESERAPAVLLFGVGLRKDEDGSEAWSDSGLVPRAVRALRAAAPELIIATDVCLCAYTSHGHCGVVRDGRVDNDPTVERLGRVAAAHARAGADVVAPSAMMDGQVAGVREGLDAAGAEDVAILAYSTKHASAFYGPFREAEGSAPAFGDRATYQMDPRNAREALREMRLDVDEGADLVMVKPAITSLDLLARARRRVDVPLAAFQVSGEYAMLKAGAARGAFEERAAVLESLTAIRRAGADLVVTYFARDVARWLRGAR